jgi:hypothetical protein
MLTLRGSEPVVRQVGSDSIDVEEISLFGSLDHLKKRSRQVEQRERSRSMLPSPVVCQICSGYMPIACTRHLRETVSLLEDMERYVAVGGDGGT